MVSNSLVAVACVLSAAPLTLCADERVPRDRRDTIQRAVERGLQIVQTAARNYPRHRQCFSFHHQTLLTACDSFVDAERR